MNSQNENPPAIFANARLLVHAIIDDSVTYTGCSTLYVDGKLLGAVPRLAICQDLYNENILLFFCNDQWESLGVTNHSSLRDAQERAEREYKGVTGKWIEANISDEEIEKYFAHHTAMRCSFCGKRPEEIEQMFQSYNACICNECVETLYGHLNN
ncbi:MAG: ClpX C4-type zinc finger protein [Gammaproteobacteria bacterium]|nr:ClpX C4-type zinc finger protein [Gammaproteobacteria bacterium]MDH5651097.1 ClpX C4-type zinc finger protein [Gammaproteobacteria bacterium]